MGLSFLVAVMQTLWHRSGADEWRRLTRFFGTLLVINVAVGVVTGLVQEFEFGMNWSAYSRYVGDVFGGPLAMEGLAAFFLESTFLGLWLFGWDRLSRRVHLVCIWMVALGATLSAAFIMAANSWMQHPVGYAPGADGEPPQLNDIGALFTNPVFIWGYFHVLLAALATGTLVLLAVSAWHLRRGEVDAFRQQRRRWRSACWCRLSIAAGPGRQPARRDRDAVPADEDRGRRGAVGDLPAVLVLGVPDRRRQQRRGPDEDDRDPAPALDPGHAAPGTARSSGSTSCRRSTSSSTGPGNYIPNVFIQYWSMRVMAYLGDGARAAVAVGRVAAAPAPAGDVEWFLRVAIWAVFAPFVMNTAGWMLTENGRQPWIVQGLMKTADGISPSVSTTEIWISLVAFALHLPRARRGELVLMLRYARRGPARRSPRTGARPSRP